LPDRDLSLRDLDLLPICYGLTALVVRPIQPALGAGTYGPHDHRRGSGDQIAVAFGGVTVRESAARADQAFAVVSVAAVLRRLA